MICCVITPLSMEYTSFAEMERNTVTFWAIIFPYGRHSGGFLLP